MTQRAAKTEDYEYVTLDRVKIGNKVNLYGVVKFVQLPYKTRGSDYCMMISIVDPTYNDNDQKLKCLLFGRGKSQLPSADLGDIVRFHRLSIKEFKGAPQGQSSPGFSWLVFSGDLSDSLEPTKSNTTTYKFTDKDKEKVLELRQWASGQTEFQKKSLVFSDVTCGAYFDIICQVVCTSVIVPNVGRLMKVWDGTQVAFPVRNVGQDAHEEDVCKDHKLTMKSRGFTYDVSVFDNHFKASQNIKPSDFVMFVNLHAAEYKFTRVSDETANVPVCEFVLHRGSKFGRSVTIIPSDSSLLDDMKQRMETIACENECNDCDADALSSYDADTQSSFESLHHIHTNKHLVNNEHMASSSRVPVPKRKLLYTEKVLSDNENDSNSDNKAIDNKANYTFKQTMFEKAKEVIYDNSSSTNPSLKFDSIESGKNMEVVRVQAKQPCISETFSSFRCMQQTATVVISHEHIQRSNLCDVLKHDFPYKFRVQAQVYDYYPKPDCLKDFIRLYCSSCHYLCSFPETNSNKNNSRDGQPRIGSTFNGVPHYICPQCPEISMLDMDSPPHLKFIYMMRMLLKDGTGMLMANIWQNDAEQFFQDIKLEQLLKHVDNFHLIKELLNQICPLHVCVDQRPWIECCIKSYSNSDGTWYQIFDTVIV